jgi:hypothetical protein
VKKTKFFLARILVEGDVTNRPDFDELQGADCFLWVFSLTGNDRWSNELPADHPLRMLRKMTNEIFKQLLPRFDRLYSRVGDRRSRQSDCCEHCCRKALLGASERMLMEHLSHNRFRWFVGLNMDNEVWNAGTFSKNRVVP